VKRLVALERVEGKSDQFELMLDRLPKEKKTGSFPLAG
jgi:hypothetical protein